MDSTPTASAPTLNGTRRASSPSSSLHILENAPSSAVDVVVVLSQLDTYRKRQVDCCERLKAAKLPARILTFTYKAQPRDSMSNCSQALTCAEAAAIFCRSLSSERKDSGRKNVPIVFVTTRDSVYCIISMILNNSLEPRAETDIEKSLFTPIKRSTFGELYVPSSPYTYRQRVLETAILSSLQVVINSVLHIYMLYCGSLCETSWPIWSLLPVIGFLVTTCLSERPFFGMLFFWIGVDLIIESNRNSPALLFVQKALKYILLVYFASGYLYLATMQLDVNHNDQLQWMFIVVGISAVIAKYWSFATTTWVNIQALTLPLAFSITASMVLSAGLHGVWHFILNGGESEAEKRVKMLVQRASGMDLGDPSRFVEFQTLSEYRSNFTLQYFAWDPR